MSKRLSLHICTLLVEHHCVVVPGLGGFVLEALPAHWDEVAQLAYPPSVELHFQEALSHQDGLLESAYASRHGISMRRARVMVEEEIRQMRSQLLSQRVVELEGLGTLELNGEGKLVFVPQPSDLMQSSAYGLSPASLPSIHSEATSSEGAHDPSPEHTSEGGNSRYIHLRLPKRALTAAASVAIFALALLPWGRGLERGGVVTASFAPSTESLSTPHKAERPEHATSETAKATPSAQGEPQASNVVRSTQQAGGAETPQMIEPVAGRYYIIVASEPSVERITELYRTALGEKGQMQYPELCVLKGAKMHKVSVASFATQNEAYTYLNQLSRKSKSAWVLKG